MLKGCTWILRCGDQNLILGIAMLDTFLISAIVPALITGEVREGSGQFDQGYV